MVVQFVYCKGTQPRSEWCIYAEEELFLIHLLGWVLLSIREIMAVGIPTILSIFLAGQKLSPLLSIVLEGPPKKYLVRLHWPKLNERTQIAEREAGK